MILREEQIRNEAVLTVAKKIAIAARTAPKGKGVDNLEIVILTDDDIERLACAMCEIAEKEGRTSFKRDAENCRNSQAVMLFGTKVQSLGLNCTFCGFKTCAEKDKQPSIPCFFNANDLGIAIGSAVSCAADNRIDNRVMYTIGYTATKMNLLPDCPIVLGIPLSVSGKSPFFDRK
ncbi:MAG: ferredoxin [Bacteroidales bacterium]|nr:ferredoxin [Bacteroidales bacterium]